MVTSQAFSAPHYHYFIQQTNYILLRQLYRNIIIEQSHCFFTEDILYGPMQVSYFDFTELFSWTALHKD